MAMAAFALPHSLFAYSKKQKPKLSFSTLGCPKWSLPDIVKFAAANGYQGVEIRTIQGEMELYKCAEFSTTNMAATKQLFKDNNLKITDLGCGASLHHKESAIRKKNLDEARLFIDLAQKLESPYIRVFPNNLPADDTRSVTLHLITEGLLELGAYAKGSNVKVLMETHGDLIKTDELLSVIEKAPGDTTGLVWDVVNMWAATKEAPSYAYQKLKKYIKHVHVKDLALRDGKEKYVLLGKGEAPIKDAIELLYSSGYKGFYSFEWEKMWHPEIEEAEVALAHYPKEISSYFN